MTTGSEELEYGKVDPHYLRILPRHFKLIDSIKIHYEYGLEQWRKRSDQKKKVYLVENERFAHTTWLSLLDYSFHADKEVIQTLMGDPTFLPQARQEYHASNISLIGVQVEEDYIELKGIMQALWSVGLDIHGGLHRLAGVVHYCRDRKIPVPTTSLLVTDRTKASCYIDVGVHLQDPSMSAQFLTLEQTAWNYARIEELTKMSELDGMGRAMAEVKIRDSLIHGGYYELKWEGKREIYRFRVFMKYREIMTRMPACADSAEKFREIQMVHQEHLRWFR